MFDGRFRSSVDRGVSPFGEALKRTRLTPDHLTALGLVLAVPSAVAVASGRLILGLALFICSAIPDLLDGALAKASGTASTRGAFFDSVADRVSDALILGGIAWYLQSRHHGHAAMLPFAILAVSTLISYQRAKAESLGYSAKGGLMERAERIVVLCIGLAFSVALVPLLWAMLVLTGVTAVQRFARVWHQASQPGADDHHAEPDDGGGRAPRRADDEPVAAGPAGRPGSLRVDDGAVAMAERWRAWRASASGLDGSARSKHLAPGSRRNSRWQERRLERRDAGEEPGPSRRGPGSRRP